MRLKDQTVLIVEDEVLIAMDLSDTVIAAGGRVLGPVGTVAEGLSLLAKSTPDAAICDAMLADRDVTPLAQALLDRGVVVLVHSATGPPPELNAACAGLPSVRKPANADRVVGQVADLLAQARR